MPQPHPRMGQPLLTVLKEAHLAHTCRQTLEAVEICKVTEDSRAVGPGSLFVAVAGTRRDGRDFIEQAIRAGAAAVVTTSTHRLDCGVPTLVVDDARTALAKLSAAHAGLTAIQARGALPVVGVTGTNGKSTTCYLLQHILKSAGHRTALIGTIQYDLLGGNTAARWTTPPAPQLAQYLVEAHTNGARFAVIEVSSHALAQHRTDGVQFETAVFTNLSGDHLDYHGTAGEYLSAKKRLFDHLPESSTAVVNLDAPESNELIADCPARVVRFGTSALADVRASNIQCDIRTSRFTLVLAQHEYAIELPLIGLHNVSNALAAAAAAESLGIDGSTIQTALCEANAIPGRLERVEPDGNCFSVFVDYAHTDDALRNVLCTLRPLTGGKLWCVFGCGGDRDPTKRPRMAGAAANYADKIIVTSDNPRSEDPRKIIDEILAGFGGKLQTVTVEPDRRRAIHAALQDALPGDTVLIAGKGHEDYQLVGDKKLHFDDVEVVHEFFATSDATYDEQTVVSECAGEAP